MKVLTSFPLMALTALFLLAGVSNISAQDFFSDTNAFINGCVEDGKVDYESLIQDPSQLNKLYEQVASYSLKSDRSDYPFYMNAYNIIVIKSVIDHSPIGSPMDVKGFFDGISHTIAGKEMTLNDLENKLIRPVYNDARIHFALVCGAIGCPQLASVGFTPKNVEGLLNKRTSKAMDDANFIKVDEGAETVAISKIFEWYRSDFGTTDAEIIEYINKYRSVAIPTDYKISYYEYDWTLNAQ